MGGAADGSSAAGAAGLPPVLGIAGWSGSGKTTLLERLLPRLAARGLRVAVIKHAHHGFDLDRPGKDSWRHREAGAVAVLVTSGQRWALQRELRGAPEPTLAQQLALVAPCDLALVEGYKRMAIPKIEVHRPALGKPPLHADDPHVVAVASDAGPPGAAGVATGTDGGTAATALPWLSLDDPAGIADFILEYLGIDAEDPAS